MASYSGTTLYCTPIQAEKVSTYPYMYETEVIINRTDAQQLADAFNDGEAGITLGIGTLAAMLFSPLGPFSVILGTVAGFCASVAVELWDDRDSYFQSLANNPDRIESWKMDIKYKYDRHGSNDGWWVMQEYTVY